MTTTNLLIIIGLVVIVGIFIIFPEARKLIKGFFRLFIKDMAETPEGAEAIYEEKIHEVENAYNTASDSLKRAAGRLATEQKNLEYLSNKLKSVERECEALVQSGKDEDALIKVEERGEILSSINRTKQLVLAYSQAKEEAQAAFNHCEKSLIKLKREKTEIVENIRVKGQLKEIYDDMDELKVVTATDKMLDTVRTKNKDLNSEIEGAKVLHENKLSTKISKAEATARQVQDDDYLANLKKKYNR